MFGCTSTSANLESHSVQVTSRIPAQFIVGRFLVYTAVGLVENVSTCVSLSTHSSTESLQVVPTYQSEIAPGALRGFFVGSIQLCLTTGSLIAGIVNESMSRKTDDSGWQIATALQALPAVIILALLFFTPNSPRWLVFNDRHEEAIAVLHSVRRKEDIDNGLPELEIASMRAEGQVGRQKKGGWKDLFNAANRRRTGYVILLMNCDSSVWFHRLTVVFLLGLLVSLWPCSSSPESPLALPTALPSIVRSVLETWLSCML